MSLPQEHIDRLRTLLESRYPGWEGLDDPRLVKGEVAYKRKTIEKAKELLSRQEMSRLIDASDFDGLIERLESLGRDSNLLWNSVPSEGDLKILYLDQLDREAFCRTMLDLIHGDGNGPARLGRYLRYVRKEGLPDRWPFATYFLFICHPESELFVKPDTTRGFLSLIGREDLYSSQPSDEIYEELLEIAGDVQKAFTAEGATDMVHVQSIIWICAHAGSALNLTKKGIQHEDQLRRLISECADKYPATDAGEEHIQKYPELRSSAAQNLEDVLKARERGEDITDLVLLKLLPYSDTESNRAAGAWVTVAPAIQGDIKKWFENAGWRDESDWPQVADRILQFVERALDEPAEMRQHCKSFSNSKFSTGFQTGMLTPILAALHPDQYVLINNKSRATINYFLGTKFSPKLTDYPDLNIAGRFLIQRLRQELDPLIEKGARPEDAFDMFCHWLVAEKGFSFGKSRYWKVAPGRGAEYWDQCREGRYIGVGWDSLGDLSKMSEEEFQDRLEELVQELDDWTEAGAKQAWTFATEIQEGDIIVANRGTTQVVGIGKVVGPYYFVDGVHHGHRLPVDWFDTTPREVNQGGWRSTLIELDAETVEAIREESPDQQQDHRPMFSERTFDLLESISEDPTKDFYDAHKEDFKEYVEQPLKELMNSVASLLPPEMTEVLETSSRLFSRIAKNDYGRGGAWDFYWGAFYPKGQKRISSAQLFAWLNRNVLDFGFYIGEYGSEQRKRFLRNIKENQTALKSVLPEYIDEERLALGGTRGDDGLVPPDTVATSLDEWLEEIAESEIRVSRAVLAEELLTTDQKALRQDVLRTFRSLFPLVLLASSDEPLKAIADLAPDEGEEGELHPEYTLEQCADETGFDSANLERWVAALKRKRQAILYGPPGTGKTYLAQHLAKHLIGGGDGEHAIIQFHPSYAYEEFIQGIRPETREDGNLAYRMVEGRFTEFCRRARGRSGTSVMIIDEINRANLSRVFGELMYLLEYRDEQVPLAGGGTFQIPKNVLIIGTMNTADRSIALVDHALRRRFTFIKLAPQYEILRSFHDDRGLNVDPLIQTLTDINTEIGDANFHLGITFFLVEELGDRLEEIWRLEIEPYLEELFFDDSGKVAEFRWERIADGVSPEQ